MPWPKDNLPINPYSALPVDVVSATLDQMGMYIGIPVPGAPIVPLLSRLGPVASIGPIFYLGDSLEDEKSEAYLTSQTLRGPSFYTNGRSWAYRVNTFFGQQCLARWAPEGQVVGNLGQNYAIGGSLTNSLSSMVTQLLADYNSTLPANCVVVVALGINDIDTSVNTYGGVWQTSPLTWTVGASGGFTVPASGNFTVTVVSTTGMVAGATNGISFQAAGVWYGPFFIQNVLTGTTVSVSTVPADAGTAIPNNAPIKISGATLLDQSVTNLQSGLLSLLAALPSTGLIVLVSPPNAGLLPGNSSTATLSTASWNYLKNGMASTLYVTSAGQVAGFDINNVFADVITNYPPTNGGVPSWYGFKTIATGWGVVLGSPWPTTGNAADFAFFDNPPFHPTDPFHRAIAARFLNFLMGRAYLSVWL